MAGGADAERRLGDLATRQHGAVARRQLVDLGFGRRAIEHRIARGRLHPVHRGVYLVGHRSRSAHAREMAALLACGEAAVLSHRTAGVLWGIVTGSRDDAVEISVPARSPRRRSDLLVHASARLGPADVRVRSGMRVTAPERTLLDLAGRLGERDLRWAVEEARLRSLVEPDGLRAAIEQHPRRRGAARLRSVVEEIAGAPTVTRSEAERRLIDLVRAAGLPAPRTNVRLHGWSVDAHWPRQRLVTEIDGFAFHASRTAFERDRRKDAQLQAAGLRVVRLSWRQITREPLAVAALLAKLLAAA